jgi:hypothetical protein
MLGNIRELILAGADGAREIFLDQSQFVRYVTERVVGALQQRNLASSVGVDRDDFLCLRFCFLNQKKSLCESEDRTENVTVR